ncbi:SEC14 domain and spectrin repeat-containing protein 1-B [Phlebotomus argentipes]|uniref:SEC14 domain and spectrin repeat-containing protein 1-B n=1 Tax=Phlebotomus argentipes TaxID=94469 RepID=UPI002893290A|nr:SEC14 domain and spectrin repeat-containing protein 1-B [Phlebotomus argentipes]
MEEDVLNALQTRSAFLPGGRDRDNNLLLVIPVPFELHPWTKPFLETSIKYILSSLSDETKNCGFTVIVDAQKCSWRLAKIHMKAASLLGANLASLIVIRPDAFWDKQRVENCARASKTGETLLTESLPFQPIIISKSRLGKYFDMSELPDELGGTLAYSHEQWLHNRMFPLSPQRVEEFKKAYDRSVNDLENLHVTLLDSKSLRANETEQALKTCATLNGDAQRLVQAVIENGKTLIADLSKITWNPNSDFVKSPDLVDALEFIKRMLNDVEKRQTEAANAWIDLEKSMEVARELASLEEGVAFVTNWILSTAEAMLTAQKKIGYDVQTSEELRKKHEQLEMQCWDTYGLYAELLHKINMFDVPKDSFMHKDLMSKKDYMDFVCRSFATRLERRRNTLITSLRFFRLVSEYFDRTSEVFESLVMRNRLDDFEMAPINLQKLKDSQQDLESVERELVREGEKLSDMLAMPVKDALGCDIGVDYSEDIVNIRDILDASIARRNIFIDSVELQKLTLEQVTYIHSYEEDARTAIKWMEDLYSVMIKLHSHVGCNMYEIQTQKEELQTFQETAKGIFSYGCQLLEASLTLRQSCKLEIAGNSDMLADLQRAWSNLQAVSQEQMTRLRVSAVFHRSVEDHCQKLQELRVAVETTCDIDDPDRRRSRLRKYLACRERLLVEVGRMVRLGRLLKTRLKEAFVLDDNSDGMSSSGENNRVVMASDNVIACEAISEKLNTVATVAEALDNVLRDTQHGLEVIETTTTEKKSENGTDDWNSSLKSSKSSTEDESFITASDCTWTPQSRSSSYHTASECRASPWWDSEKNSLDIADVSDIETEVPSNKLSSNSASFDESEHSFRSQTTHSPLYAEHSDSDDARKRSHRGRDSPDPGVLLDDEKSDRKNEADVVEKVRSDANPSAHDFLAWNGYYQSFITKQTIKGCF